MTKNFARASSNTSFVHLDDILLLIEACFKTFQSEFKLYLSGVLPDMIKKIISDQSEDRVQSIKV